MTLTDFSRAQERIAARRRARESVAPTDTPSNVTNALGHLPLGSKLRGAGLQTWEAVRGREGTRPAFRVGQVDAELLDEELLELLKGQVGEGLKYFGSHLRDDWSAEIVLALRAILFKVSIWDHDATYGAALQNLKYTDARVETSLRAAPSRWQKGLYGLFSVGGKYAWGKWEDWLVDQEGGVEEPSRNVRLLSRATNAVSTVHSVAGFASFLVFLMNGKYRTLLDRVLRLRLTPPTSQVSREVSFEYLNRQLVWHAFTEFLLFVLPLVGIGRWRRWLSRVWRKAKSTVWKRGDGQDEEETKGELAFLPERTCAICYQDQNPTTTSENDVMAVSGASGGVVGSADTDITNPYETIPCRCIYCFVCLAHRLEAEEGEGWTCLRCGEIVKECRPWQGDVLEEVIKTGEPNRNVTFADKEDEGTEEEKVALRRIDARPVDEADGPHAEDEESNTHGVFVPEEEDTQSQRKSES